MLAMSFPSNKRAASQKLNPFHGRRIAERDDTANTKPHFPPPASLPANPEHLGSCAFFLEISLLQDGDAASFLYVDFSPVLTKKRQDT